MASLTVGQSYKSLACDFGRDGEQWNVNLVNLVNLMNVNDPEISITSPLKLHKDTGFVQISMVEQNYPGEILPSQCTFLPSQVSWYIGSSDTEWMSKDVEILKRNLFNPEPATRPDDLHVTWTREVVHINESKESKKSNSLIRSRFLYVFCQFQGSGHR